MIDSLLHHSECQELACSSNLIFLLIFKDFSAYLPNIKENSVQCLLEMLDFIVLLQTEQVGWSVLIQQQIVTAIQL